MAKKNRRSFAQIFLDTLESLSGDERRNVGNTALLRRLGWNKTRYQRIKSELLGSGKISTARGKGGAVRLAEAGAARTPKIFIAYSHADKELKNELIKHLEPLKKMGLIEAWHDQELKGGDEWDKSIQSHLSSAQIVLLLVSVDFINSAYGYDVEFQQALSMQEAERATVIPVILRACMWKETPLHRFQALPKDGKAVSSWDDRDEALTNVAQGIKDVAVRLTPKR